MMSEKNHLTKMTYADLFKKNNDAEIVSVYDNNFYDFFSLKYIDALGLSCIIKDKDKTVLFDTESELIKVLSDDILKKIKYIAPTHCSGKIISKILKKEQFNKFIEFGLGKKLSSRELV